MTKDKIMIHGFIGFLIIVIVELLIMFRYSSISKSYFPVIWLGYILMVDGIVYNFRGTSLMKSRKSQFILLFLLSAVFWWVFEIVNIFIHNWKYTTLPGFSSSEYFIVSSISFVMVLPAILETTHLISIIKIFENIRIRKRYKVNRYLLYLLIGFGVISLFLPVFFPGYTFLFLWITFFLLLDPINYLYEQSSIIKNLSEYEFEVPLSLVVAGIACGFFWEFWNYWAFPKWVNAVPFFDFYRSFDITIWNYIGLLFFPWSIYAMYHFSKFLIKKSREYVEPKVKDIKDNFFKNLFS